VTSAHGKEVIVNKTTIFNLNPMLRILDLGLGKLVTSVHGKEVFVNRKTIVSLC
jgi:hypothetical protein